MTPNTLLIVRNYMILSLNHKLWTMVLFSSWVVSCGLLGANGFLMLCNGPLRKHTKSFGDVFQDYDRIQWQWTLLDLEKAIDVAYPNVLNESDLIWGVQGLIVTQSNILITWKDRPPMSIIIFIFPWVVLVHMRWLCFGSFLAIEIFNLCQKIQKKYNFACCLYMKH